MKISVIAAMGQNRVIGSGGKLPWHLPADMRHFKELTAGHPVIMGKTTFASLGRPLPSRTNIVLSNIPGYQAPGCTVAGSFAQAIEAARATGADEAFIIGGANVYAQGLPLAETLYLTLVGGQFAGDAFFPPLDQAWREVSRQDMSADEKNPYPLSFVTYQRQK